MAENNKEKTIPDPRINKAIRATSVRVIDEDGKQLGVMLTADALALASDRELDLVEVAPTSTPPVCRIIDYGHFHYEQTKREREKKRSSHATELKEIKVRVTIGVGDLGTKVRQATSFLDAGHRVRVSCQFRGREMAHSDLGRDLLMRFAGQIEGHGTMERSPVLEGKVFAILLVPDKSAPKPVVAAN